MDQSDLTTLQSGWSGTTSYRVPALCIDKLLMLIILHTSCTIRRYLS